MEAKKDLEI